MPLRLGTKLVPIVLKELMAKFPESLPVFGTLKLIQSHGMEVNAIWVDKWPNFEAIVIRLLPSECQTPTLTETIRMFSSDADCAYKLLSQLNLFGTQERIDFGAIRQNLWPTVTQVAKEAAFNTDVTSLEMLHLPDIRRLPDSSKTALPSGFRMGTLESHHAPLLASLWEHNVTAAAAELYMGSLIKTFPSVAVYDESGKLASSVMCYEDGSLGNTFVFPEYRRLGLAQAMGRSMSMTLYEAGLVPFTYIESSNHTSINAALRLGYQPPSREKIAWIYCRRNRNTFRSPSCGSEDN